MERQGPGRGRSRRADAAALVRATVAELDPLRFVLASWWLALVAIEVLQIAHDGLHEHLALPPLVHLVRDAALAVPAAALAVLGGVIAAGGLLGAGRSVLRARGRIAWLAVTAVLFALVSLPGNELHGVLFGAEAEAELSPLADALLDGALALIGALLALLPFALVIGPPVARDETTEPVPTMSRRRRPGPGDLVARSTK